jgi:hypothetical protein
MTAVAVSPAAATATAASASAEAPVAPSRAALWTGRVLSGLAAAFLLMDSVVKLLVIPAAIQGTTELGYQASVIRPLGVVTLILWVLYVYPRTAILGALLWTGYLGGAVATHVRVGNPLFSHVLFPLYVAAFLWLGLWLRDARLRALLPLTRAR